jgi:plastocyanin
MRAAARAGLTAIGLGVLASALLASAAGATDLTVALHTADGAPVSDAVVSLYPASGLPAEPLKPDRHYQMAQHHIQFEPQVLIVPVGAVVDFPNQDNVRHHVYSFSPAHPFNLKLYSRDETKSERFDKVGVVALGCNIHDKMVGFIKVVDTPFAVKTSPTTGDAMIQGAPGGAVTVRIWQPYLKAPNNEIVRTVTLPTKGAAREAFTLDLRPAPKPH